MQLPNSLHFYSILIFEIAICPSGSVSGIGVIMDVLITAFRMLLFSELEL